ncbi:unnamed protein product [Spodoptera exigua]|nr:unnamed protein product [Spodoptera exigua]
MYRRGRTVRNGCARNVPAPAAAGHQRHVTCVTSRLVNDPTNIGCPRHLLHALKMSMVLFSLGFFARPTKKIGTIMDDEDTLPSDWVSSSDAPCVSSEAVVDGGETSLTCLLRAAKRTALVDGENPSAKKRCIEEPQQANPTRPTLKGKGVGKKTKIK